MGEAQLKQAIEQFKELRHKHAKAEALALEMLRHPDATHEHLASAHNLLVGIDKAMTEVVTSLRRVIPNRSLFRPYMWHDEQYNRFNQPTKGETA
jgi:hypothetical protein